MLSILYGAYKIMTKKKATINKSKLVENNNDYIKLPIGTIVRYISSDCLFKIVAAQGTYYVQGTYYAQGAYYVQGAYNVPYYNFKLIAGNFSDIPKGDVVVMPIKANEIEVLSKDRLEYVLFGEEEV